jgi:hypothetical protein
VGRSEKYIYRDRERERERERETETEILHFNVVRHIISVESFLILYKLKNNFDNIYIYIYIYIYSKIYILCFTKLLNY